MNFVISLWHLWQVAHTKACEACLWVSTELCVLQWSDKRDTIVCPGASTKCSCRPSHHVTFSVPKYSAEWYPIFMDHDLQIMIALHQTIYLSYFPVNLITSTKHRILDVKHGVKLTHWGRVTHICVGKLTNIGSDNGLSPGRRQAVIWTNAGISLIGPLGTNFSEILIGIQTFSFKKMHLKMASAKWRPFYLGLNELNGCLM